MSFRGGVFTYYSSRVVYTYLSIQTIQNATSAFEATAFSFNARRHTAEGLTRLGAIRITLFFLESTGFGFFP